ncbi:hypothetical protein [Corynebacterium accolens]|uniref:hypothetical protein n=1 Tax=Corynebacterium accolens TaxID=38284 RepID=UPI00254F1ED4|nr:hypothetical protein [Corynebacterium accolens]MDK8678308.1 hypothetical protein [Corynebacterium accolens]
MNRLPKTLTAAVLTGALALGGTTVAQAQENDNPMYVAPENPQLDPRPEANANTEADEDTTGELDEDAENNGEIERHDTAADPIVVDGVEYFKQLDGSWLSKPENGNPVRLTADQAEKFVKDQQDTSAIPGASTKTLEDGTVCYQHIQQKDVYVEDSNAVNVEVTPETIGKCKSAAGETPKPDEKKFDTKKLAWLALPAALIIGGITWYLTHDGKTYVKDEARKNEQPTAEEKAASEQMLKENKDEVIAQGGKLAEGNSAQGTTNGAQSTDNVRGMAAETGSNSIARGAVALAIAGLLAAGAFVARRKFFA